MKVYYRLASIIGFLLVFLFGNAQNPHGSSDVLDCTTCHNPEGWEIKMDTFHFDHSNTSFQLEGEHLQVDCKSCHSTLIFNQAPSDCVSCHTDVHSARLGNDCIRCHNTTNWLVDNIPELHEQNGFPLVGAHDQLSCVDCHLTEDVLRFDRVGNDCVSCHLDEFESANNPDHVKNGYSTNCLDCHDASLEDWHTEIVDHSFFPLTLGHDGPDCIDCHTTGVYAEASSDCITCHNEDRDNAKSPDHRSLNLSTDCISCHTTDPGWTPASFQDHDGQYFPIYSGAHNGVWSACVECHSDPSIFAVFTCINCHINPETDNEHEGVGGYIYEDNACLTCHPVGTSDMAFNHDETNFPLTGEHVGLDCIDCHSEGYAGTSTACVDCHTNDYSSAINPNHTVLNISTDCASCHTTEPDWQPALLVNHDDYYPLLGAHAAIANDCAACHDGDYNNTPTTCVGCHQADYNNTTNPDHGAAQFPTDCTTCHNESSWTPSTFNHSSFYPLIGAHALIENDCVSCHSEGYVNTPNTCVGCHQSDYTETTNPDHELAQFPTDCTTCHDESSWTPSTFDHSGFYPLVGAHAIIENDCIACHSDGYVSTPNTCVGCHQSDYTETTNPDHEIAQFNTDCASCHDETAWEPSSFDHDGQYFPIYSGTHDGVWSTCVECHSEPSNFAVFTCINCHINPETDDEHEGVGGYIYEDNACLTCHPVGTSDMAFNHDDTNFPLTGEHLGLDCIDCHSEGYAGTSTACVDCHTNDYSSAINPNHTVLNISTDCASCHTTEPDWQPALFVNHDEYYPLLGAHAAIANDCVACHNGDYNNTPTTCVGCHQADYNNTTNPDHGAAQFPTDCTTCHNESSWTPSTFNHNSFYPLIGAHALIENDCVSCHSEGYANTPNTCVGCHQSDYTETTNPDHELAQFPTDCTTCHNESSWTPSTFDHSSFYPLIGAHAIIENDCITCHSEGYANTPNTCVGCHQSDYNETTNPDHEIAQFNTDCASCHDETAWEPSSFDHDGQYFPIYSGTHNGVWSACVECHSEPSNFAVFTCINCHINPETDDEHEGVGGYIYEDNACLTCHPVGTSDMAFNHDDTNFPLTGEHLGLDCIDCHSEGYAGTSTACVDCHTNDYSSAINPNHTVLNISTDCASCHTTEPDWQPALFVNHDEYYPLLGAHAAIANDCVACHDGDYNNTPTTCVGCHQADYNNTTNPDHGAAQFPTDCTTCHNESSWTPSTFNHSSFYPLIGAHALIENDCVSCHSEGYVNTPNTCVGCHQSDYTETTNPDHELAQFPTDCTTCHDESSWTPSTFDHSGFYPLVGAHAIIENDCVSCHSEGYVNTPNTCVGCHQSDYNEATNPDHDLAQFPTDCTTCHDESAWTPSTFDHGSFYPLIGAHALIENDCISCHGEGYVNTPNTCIGCHQSDYNNTNDPDHLAAGFPTDCTDCHNESAWEPSTFDHNSFYPLNGAHASIANECLECHSDGFQNTPNTCIGCHRSDYDNTNDPNHAVAGFPTDCTDCHNESAWEPSTFDHDAQYFPIYSGTHQGEWNACTDCHINPGNYSIFSCIDCHEHNDPNELADDHDDVNGYVYESNACLACHPDGEE